jgi:3-methyladenine DNA glycosylase/8-oxoguanine DNA glycosylase
MDPTIRVRRDAAVRASWTPDGPVTVRFDRVDDRRYTAEAWGPGAAWILAAAPALLGADDDLTGFSPDRDPIVARAHHHRPGLRLIRSGAVWDVLVPTIIAQRVTSREAGRSWTLLVRARGEPAPGPFDLLLPPRPSTLLGLPPQEFHRLGIERARAERIVAAAKHAARLQAVLDLPIELRDEAFRRIPGIGVWTAAHLRRVAGGDPDAVESGDDGIKHHVAWNLAGEPRASDERMLELLAPFAGHRGRVVRLLLSAGSAPPNFRSKPRVIPVDRL